MSSFPSPLKSHNNVVTVDDKGKAILEAKEMLPGVLKFLKIEIVGGTPYVIVCVNPETSIFPSPSKSPKLT